MRRFNAILLLILFFSGTFNLEIKAHFCGTSLHALSLDKNAQVNEDDCCGQVNDCCSDKLASVDVDQDFIAEDLEYNVEKSSKQALANNRHRFEYKRKLNAQNLVLDGSDSSPPFTESDLHILYASILI